MIKKYYLLCGINKDTQLCDFHFGKYNIDSSKPKKNWSWGVPFSLWHWFTLWQSGTAQIDWTTAFSPFLCFFGVLNTNIKWSFLLHIFWVVFRYFLLYSSPYNKIDPTLKPGVQSQYWANKPINWMKRILTRVEDGVWFCPHRLYFGRSWISYNHFF